MKNLIAILLIWVISISAFSKPRISFSQISDNPDYIQNQVLFNPNNIYTWIQNTGVFNQDIRTNNTPGFMWPSGSSRFAIFTTGLSIGAKVNDSIRLASCSYKGEYWPGYINNGSPDSNSYFKFYKITRGDGPSNPDWLNWYRMVPYGAPYYDVNNNGVYDQGIDTPGVKNAQQTIFICMTDGFPGSHNQSEGFSGGTRPLFAEMHLTAWGYSKTAYSDMQFFRYEIINKGSNIWDSTYMAFITDADVGDAVDDFVGCDTARHLGYAYNADNQDGTGNPPSYGANPPAVGMIMLKGVHIKGSNPFDLNMTSFTYFGAPWVLCETDANQPLSAYYFLKGRKNDGSYWRHPNTKEKVFKVYTGNPENNEGWTEFGYNGNPNMGQIRNCIGGDTITTYPCNPGDMKYILGTGSSKLIVSPGDTQKIIMCQLIARGTSNVNSVTKLKQLADAAWSLYNNNFVIGIENISTEVPAAFSLYQNYPNPFNPVTKIRFDIPTDSRLSGNDNVVLKVYDILGKEVETLVNGKLQPGTYEVTWDASGFGSGVYFYRCLVSGFSETKKMVVLK